MKEGISVENSEKRVTGLYVYPIKSCRGIPMGRAEVTTAGFRYDRRWMVVDERGMFVAQRGDGQMGVAVKSMCMIETRFAKEELVLSAPGMGSLALPLGGLEGENIEVQIWKNSTTGIFQGQEASRWFTEYLSRERKGSYRLVRMSETEVRSSKRGQGQLAFADAYPFLIISDESLYDLNSRMAEKLPMNRFRPNIVIGNSGAYEEDRWAQIEINGVVFNGTTLCVRCPITTANQLTGERGKEPLKTLATYRRTEDGVVFGRNFNNNGTGFISLGDIVTAHSYD